MAFEAKFLHGDPIKSVDHTPSSAVVAGEIVVIADRPLVAHRPIDANALGALAAGGGVYQVLTDAAIANDKKVYWDNTANRLSETAAGNTVFGYSVTATTGADQLISAQHEPEKT